VDANKKKEIRLPMLARDIPIGSDYNYKHNITHNICIYIYIYILDHRCR